MASLSYYGAFMFFLASTITYSALAVSQYTINDPICALPSTETFINLTKSAIEKVSNASLDFAPNGPLEKHINNTSPNDKVALSALGGCRQLFSLAIDNLNNTLSSSFELRMSDGETRDNFRFWNCFSATNLETCIDEFISSASQIQDLVSTKLNSSLNAIRELSEILYNVERCYSPIPSDNHFVEKYYTTSGGRDPYWLSSEDKEIIESEYIKPNIVVAKDGSGNYRTITDAIKAVPNNNEYLTYIYVKKGIYFENLVINQNQWNIFMYGDGMNKTIVSQRRSNAGGYSIVTSATFAVNGKRFFARDIGFYNIAGPSKGQAVALLSASDRSVFYRCRIDGYQDTLHLHAGLQFYRECYIYGTIDFIFGGAAAVIQNSTILVRKPLQGQGNAIVAHTRVNQQCNTGIVIQSSTIEAAEDLRGVGTALGRPWNQYAITVYMENYMGSLISPFGWELMQGRTPPSTIFLAEHGNKGPGSNVAGRVKWAGVRTSLSYEEANKYTVNSLIRGYKWLPSTKVPYNPGL